jgi:surface antigen
MRSKPSSLKLVGGVGLSLLLAASLSGIGLAITEQTAVAATGGYPYASAPCSDTTYVNDGVTYCAGDNWTGPYGLYDPTYGGYGYRNCTDWVAYRLATNNGYEMPRAIGDASAWGSYFEAQGVAVNNLPAVGAIAWESHGDHVAYVESVGSGTVTISEYNHGYYPGLIDGDGLYDTRTVATSAFEYIHVKDLSSSSGGGGPEPLATPLALGELSNSGDFQAKSGIGGGWIDEQGDVSAIAIASDPVDGVTIGELDDSGNFWAKSGIGGGWIDEQGAVEGIAVNSDATNGVTIGALDDSGNFWAKSGIGGGWIDEHGDVSVITTGGVSSSRIADAPTIGTATAGAASASVSFLPPAFDGGSAIARYTVTASPGGSSQTGSASPITVTGLTNGVAYTFTVTATNAMGTGAASAPSNGVTPATVPGPPVTPSAIAASASAKVHWVVPANNGAAISNFVITPYVGSTAETPVHVPAGATGSATDPTPGAADSFTVTGLTNGTAYTFKVAAINAVGTGPNSAASNSVPPSSSLTPTPTVPGAPTIGTATAGNASATITWTAPSSNGGSAITSYAVRPYIGTTAQTIQTFTSTATTETATGLTNGTAYTFKVAAINAVGTGPNSAASNSVTPVKATSRTTITTITTITSVTSNPVVGQPVVIGVWVTGSTTTVGLPTPTGQVIVTDGTRTCEATLTGSNGTASGTCSITEEAVNSYALTASYAGDANFNTSSTSVSTALSVGKATSKTALKLSVRKLAYGDEQVEYISVTVSPQHRGSTPGGTVTIKASATTLCVIKVASGKGWWTMSPKKLKAGTYHFVATYSGNKNFKGSTSVKVTLTVVKR